MASYKIHRPFLQRTNHLVYGNTTALEKNWCQFNRNVSYMLQQQTKGKTENAVRLKKLPKFDNLQPSMGPKLITTQTATLLREDKEKSKGIIEPNEVKGFSKVIEYITVPIEIEPFPPPVINPSQSNRYHEKLLKQKPTYKINTKICTVMLPYNIRFFTTASGSRQSRSFSTTSTLFAKVKKDLTHCDVKKQEICKKKTVKKECKKPAATRCPVFLMDNCPCKFRTNCDRMFQGKPCKRIAPPYPSYSEACAEEYPDDPSECYQCPWKKCPPKGGRSYHTLSNPKAIPNVVDAKLFHTQSTPLIENNFPTSLSMDYGLKGEDIIKPPCKPPPPKCDPWPKGKKDKTKKEKCIPQTKPRLRKKKASSSWNEAYHLWAQKNEVDSNILEDIRQVEEIFADGKFPFDKREADYEHKRQKHNVKNHQEWPCCPKKHRKLPIKDCPRDKCINESNKDNSVGMILDFKESFILPLINEGNIQVNQEHSIKLDSKKDDCPQPTIKPIPVNKSYNVKSFLRNVEHVNGFKKLDGYRKSSTQDEIGNVKDGKKKQCPRPQDRRRKKKHKKKWETIINLPKI